MIRISGGGAGELNIPAVRGLGGSLLYFIDNARCSAAGQRPIS